MTYDPHYDGGHRLAAAEAATGAELARKDIAMECLAVSRYRKLEQQQVMLEFNRHRNGLPTNDPATCPPNAPILGKKEPHLGMYDRRSTGELKDMSPAFENGYDITRKNEDWRNEALLRRFGK
jgi:hypothetical protein